MNLINKLAGIRSHTRYRTVILFFVDMCIVFGSIVAAFGLSYESTSFQILSENRTSMAIFVLSVLAVFTLLMLANRVYRSLWTFLGVAELVTIGYVALTGSLVSGFLYLSIVQIDYHRLGFIIMLGMFAFLGMITLRFFYRALRERATISQYEDPRMRALIIGAGEAGYVLLKELQKNTRLHAQVIGFVDNHHLNHVVSGLPVLGKLENIPELVKSHKIQTVYFADSRMSQQQKTNTINTLKDLKIEMKIMSFAEEQSEGSVASRIKDVSTEDLLGRGQINLDQKEVASYLEGKTVMVTGAGGSIGSQLVREIIRYKPKQICMLDMNENGLYLLERDLDFNDQGSQNYDESQLVSLVADIRELDALDTIFDRFQPDVVFHAAAHKHVHLMELRPQEAIKNNIFGTKNMIDCAVKHKVKRFIQISTDKAVNPANVMGASKRMTELILQARGQTIKTTKFAAVRFGNVLGSSGSVIPIFKAQIARGGPVTLTHRDMTRYFMTIPEAAQLVLQAGYYAKNGDIFVLNMGKPVKIIDLAENLISLSGLEPYIDIDIKEIGLRPGEKMFEELSLQCEKATKTKNNLIFKNRPIKIDQKALTKKLTLLQKLVDDHASSDIIKAELLNMIQEGS